MITGISVKLCNVMSCLSCQEVEFMVALQLRPLQSQRPPSDHWWDVFQPWSEQPKHDLFTNHNQLIVVPDSSDTPNWHQSLQQTRLESQFQSHLWMFFRTPVDVSTIFVLWKVFLHETGGHFHPLLWQTSPLSIRVSKTGILSQSMMFSGPLPSGDCPWKPKLS